MEVSTQTDKMMKKDQNYLTGIIILSELLLDLQKPIWIQNSAQKFKTPVAAHQLRNILYKSADIYTLRYCIKFLNYTLNSGD
jgi:hypothetical protein